MGWLLFGFRRLLEFGYQKTTTSCAKASKAKAKTRSLRPPPPTYAKASVGKAFAEGQLQLIIS
jgi:hypothetical protein